MPTPQVSFVGWGEEGRSFKSRVSPSIGDGHDSFFDFWILSEIQGAILKGNTIQNRRTHFIMPCKYIGLAHTLSKAQWSPVS